MSFCLGSEKIAIYQVPPRNLGGSGNPAAPARTHAPAPSRWRRALAGPRRPSRSNKFLSPYTRIFARGTGRRVARGQGTTAQHSRQM
eukprot:306726-Prymnesium_polylepis.1